jgi:hypothetical protein
MRKLLRVLAVIAAVVVLAIVAIPAVDAAYTRDLTIGSSGSDVAELQAFLVSKGFLVMPAGTTPGYFGAMTQAALARYQAANGIAPAAGYFGPMTRAAVAGSSSTGSTSTGSGSSSTQTSLGRGEASLESFDLDDEEDEIKEGSSEVVAIASFDVEDGDVEIQRVDVSFEFDGQGTADSKPWKVFDEIVLKADGKKIGSVDASDKDDWLDDDGPVFVVRFSGLKYIVRDGDTAEIEISVSAQNNVDGADDGDAEWIVFIDNNDIRAIDGEGIDQYIGKGSETVSFEFVSESEGDDLELKDSDDEIEEDTIVLDEKKTTDAPILAFVLSAEDSDTDVEINEIEIDIVVSSGTIGDLVKDFWIEIDGEEIDAESYNDNGLTATLSFDVDGDVTIDADDEVEVVLYAMFRAMDEDSDLQGATIVASLDRDQIDAEGADDITVGGSDVNGEEQTLMTSGVVAEFVSESFTAENASDGKNGMIKIVFDLTGVGDDFEIANDGSDFNYTLTNATEVDARVAVRGETARSGDFTIKDGETDRVTFSIEFNNDSGFVGLEIDEILGYIVRNIVANEGN